MDVVVTAIRIRDDILSVACRSGHSAQVWRCIKHTARSTVRQRRCLRQDPRVGWSRSARPLPAWVTRLWRRLNRQGDLGHGSNSQLDSRLAGCAHAGQSTGVPAIGRPMWDLPVEGDAMRS